MMSSFFKRDARSDLGFQIQIKEHSGRFEYSINREFFREMLSEVLVATKPAELRVISREPLMMTRDERETIYRQMQAYGRFNGINVSAR